MRWGDTISVDVNVMDILPQLDKNEVAEYFKLGEYDDSTPFGLICHLKYKLCGKRILTPTDIKEEICTWIDDNLYNCI